MSQTGGMLRIPVSSSAIGLAGGNLRVLFRNGRLHHHPGVPFGVYLALLLAQSNGAYYNAAIRGMYR